MNPLSDPKHMSPSASLAPLSLILVSSSPSTSVQTRTAQVAGLNWTIPLSLESHNRPLLSSTQRKDRETVAVFVVNRKAVAEPYGPDSAP